MCRFGNVSSFNSFVFIVIEYFVNNYLGDLFHTKTFTICSLICSYVTTTTINVVNIYVPISFCKCPLIFILEYILFAYNTASTINYEYIQLVTKFFSVLCIHSAATIFFYFCEKKNRMPNKNLVAFVSRSSKFLL